MAHFLDRISFGPSCLRKSFAAVTSVFRHAMQSLLDGYVETNPDARGGRRRLGWHAKQYKRFPAIATACGNRKGTGFGNQSAST
jgi:hypothetical protein